MYCRKSCAINLGSTVVITGNDHNSDGDDEKVVTEYNEDGFMRELPHLLVGRYNHACAYFVNDQRTKVVIDTL